MLSKFLLVSGYALAIVTGFFFGSINIHEIKFEKEINIVEGLNLLVTLGIGLIIPLVLKKFLDDRGNIKALIIDQVHNLIKETKESYKEVNNCYSKGSITPENKDRIISFFSNAEMQLDSIREQLKVSFPNKSASDNLTNALIKYKGFLTGGELMNSRFTIITDDFYAKNKTEFLSFQKDLMVEIHYIYKY